MTVQNYCSCETWQYFTRNYYETFYWHEKAKKWYIQWVSLADQGGVTQVSKYGIPINFCPYCGNHLEGPEES